MSTVYVEYWSSLRFSPERWRRNAGKDKTVKEVLEDGNQEVRISGLQEREARDPQELWQIIESAAT